MILEEDWPCEWTIRESRHDEDICDDWIGILPTFEEVAERLGDFSRTNAISSEEMSAAMSGLSAATSEAFRNLAKDLYGMTIPIYHNFIANDIVVHNCAEEPLPAGGSCLLGALNLAEFVTNGAIVYEVMSHPYNVVGLVDIAETREMKQSQLLDDFLGEFHQL